MNRASKCLLAALLGSLGLVACDHTEAPASNLSGACSADFDAISSVQGTDFKSPLLGQMVTVRGVVTYVAANGFYIESTNPDSNPRSSEGLFVEASNLTASLDVGQLLEISGEVAELGDRRDTMTSLVSTSDLSICGQAAELPETRFDLPLSQGPRENFEGMRIEVGARVFVTDVYRLKDGQFRVSTQGPLPIPTEVAWPGNDARRQQSENWSRSLHVQLAPGDQQWFSLGSELLSDSGVLGHDGRGPRLLLGATARVAQNEPPVLPAPQDNELRIVSLNLQNYFNGQGTHYRFPAERGARTARQFAEQRARLVASLRFLNPHILAVQELENDGFESHSASSSLLEDLEQATSARWRVVNPGLARIGSDEITTGLFYRPDLVETAGSPAMLDAAPFDLLNRTPYGQSFLHPDTGQRFFVAVNHFKSKGGCPERGRDRDQDDGQGCWNAARTQAATALAAWVTSQAMGHTGGKALVLGDLNAYRMEDPVRALIDAGFNDLTSSAGSKHRFSYVYAGQSGTLDHALATPALASSVRRAQIVNINSPYPPDVSVEPLWLRSSDHDPVVIDLRFNQSATWP